MQKDSIKISQEINFNGLPTWVSIGASLQPEDNVLESLRSLQKDITDYQTQEQQAYSKSKWEKKNDNPVTNEIQSALDGINACEELEGNNGLKRWWTKSKSNLTLSTAYKAKEKQLTDAK